MTPCREREAARQAAETRYAEPGTWHLEQAAHVTHLEHHTLCLCGAISVLPKAVAVHTTWIDE